MSDSPTNRLGDQASPEQPPKGGCDPAMANCEFEWVGQMAKLGFTVCCVQVRFSEESIPFPRFEEQIGCELTDAGVGHFDSMRQGDPFFLFFYLDTKKLTGALQYLKYRLECYRVFHLCRVGVADCEQRVWRTWTPPPDGQRPSES